MLIHHFKKRVRYGETDQMGYLYYGNYPEYYEIGRAELMRHLGFTYQRLEDEKGVMMPVMTMQMRYVRPARYDELLTIKTTLRKMPTQFITFHTEIYNEKEELVNGGSIKLCFVEKASNTTIPTPEFLLDIYRPYFE